MAKKKIGILVGLIAIAGAFFFFKQLSTDSRTDYYYRDEFDMLNEDMWYVGEWGTGFPKPEKVTVKNSILTAIVGETDRGPFLLSKPIDIKANSLITVKRRVKLKYGNNQFTGGFTLYQTDQRNVAPELIDKEWFKNFGQALMLMEYVHTSDTTSTRPGNHNFRLLVPDWQETENYAIATPIFDEWFEETFTFDCSTGRITYTNGDKLLVLKGYRPTQNRFRIFMHPYGFYTGHEMKIDWIEVKVTQPERQEKPK